MSVVNKTLELANNGSDVFCRFFAFFLHFDIT